MIVSPIIEAVAALILWNLPLHLKSVADNSGLANPLFWGPGFVLGLLLSYVTRQRAARWVWLCGFTWLAVGVWDSVHHYDSHFYQGCSAFENVVNGFFILNSHRCGGGSSTLEGLFFTMPALNSAAYAVGAWVATKYMGRFDRTDTKQPTATLGLS
jgi:hypothetical protein